LCPPSCVRDACNPRQGDKRAALRGSRSRRSRCNRPVPRPCRPLRGGGPQWPDRFRRCPARLSGPCRSTCDYPCGSWLRCSPLILFRMLVVFLTLAFFYRMHISPVAFRAPLVAFPHLSLPAFSSSPC